MGGTVKGRLALGAVVIAAVVGVLAWGLFPGSASHAGRNSANRGPASSQAVTASPTGSPSALPLASSPQGQTPYVQPPTVPDVTKMRLVFNASFTGSALNPSVWDTCFPWISNQASGCTNYGDGEAEWYLPSQVRVSGGALHLVAEPIATPGQTQAGGSQNYNCRSGMV